MPDRPGDRRAPAPAHPLWFIAQPDAFMRRLILRTALERPRFLRRLQPRGLKR